MSRFALLFVLGSVRLARGRASRLYCAGSRDRRILAIGGVEPGRAKDVELVAG